MTNERSCTYRQFIGIPDALVGESNEGATVLTGMRAARASARQLNREQVAAQGSAAASLAEELDSPEPEMELAEEEEAEEEGVGSVDDSEQQQSDAAAARGHGERLDGETSSSDNEVSQTLVGQWTDMVHELWPNMVRLIPSLQRILRIR